jgi:hypothetical protein
MNDDTRISNGAAAGGEKDQPKKKRSGFVRFALITALVATAVLPAIAAFIFLVALPAVRLAGERGVKPRAATQPSNDIARPKSGALERKDQFELLRHDEAFWSARLELAKQPKFSLAVDLVDSLASLDVRGVPVRSCKILGIKTSHALPFMFQRREFRERMSKPLQIKSETATLPKEPIRITFAPKDSVEAELAAAKPIEPEQADVFFTLYFDGNLALTVRQSGEPISSGFQQRAKSLMRLGFEQGKLAARSLFRTELPQHELRIEVTLSREDAKALYRALGFNAKVAIRV